MAPEQQNRFAEPRSTLYSHFARPADPLDKFHQLHGRPAPLLGGGPSQVGHQRQCRRSRTKLMTQLSGYRSPAMQHRAGRCIARSAFCAVSIEPLEVEGSCAESEDPALEGAPRDANVSRDACHGNPVGERLAHRLQDNLDPGDLAG